MIVLWHYQAQVENLKNAIDDSNLKYVVSVMTVDSYQCLEADLIIMSTVRTSKIGVCANPQRLISDRLSIDFRLSSYRFLVDFRLISG